MKKGIRHAAADDEQIDLGRQIAQQIELCGNLGSADDGGYGMLGLGQRLPPGDPTPPATGGPAAEGRRCAMASVEAWARWAQEKASLT